MANHSLKSDHGKFCCAEEGGGKQGETIGNRPKGLMTATRETAGAWEHFEITATDEWEFVGLKSSDGFFACCENAQDDAKKGRNGIIVFNRENCGAWDKFKIHYVDRGNKIAFEAQCRPGYFIKAHPDGKVTLEHSFFDGQISMHPGGYETFVCDPPLSTTSVNPQNKITGQLRVNGSGYADDNGPWIPIGIHMGDLFSCYCHGHEDKVRDALTKIRDAGYGLVQFWLNLGSLGGDYWAGREIGPEITPDYWGKLARFGDLLDSFGLKGIYCTGDYELRGMSHEEFSRQLGIQLNTRNTAGLVIAGNEAWQTGADSIDTLRDFCANFKQFAPNVPITTTAPPTEEKFDIASWCDGDYYAIHGYRDGEDHDRIRHIFSVMWEGEPPTEYGYQDEPTGPGDEVSVKAYHCYHGRDVDASHLVGLAAQSVLSDQGFNFFCGDGVKLTGDIARWGGFKEVAAVVNLIPRDVMSWPGAFHFGDSQSHQRIFGPGSGNNVRFDCRVAPDGRIYAVLYGDEGGFAIRCHKRCHVKVQDYLGNVVIERDYSPGEDLTENFVRSQNGQPGRTSFIVNGKLL